MTLKNHFQFLILTMVLMISSGAKAEPIDPELRRLLIQTIEGADSFNDRFDAEVWLVDMSARLKPFIKKDKARFKLLRMVHREAKRAQLKPELVLSVIQIESHFDPYALSISGAQGLMQIMPFWKSEIGRAEDNLMNPSTNLRYGCTILSYYLEKEKGDLTRALARYNGSLGKTIYPEKVLVAWEDRWFTNN